MAKRNICSHADVMGKLKRIISGGQTGVDQTALRVAEAFGFEVGGWCPPGRVCETGKIPDSFPLKETPHDKSPDAPQVPRSQRTEWNVRDSDATLIFRPQRTQPDPGTDWTHQCAIHYCKLLLVCNPNLPDERERVVKWLESHKVETLNVAGPSAKTCPGIGKITAAFLAKIFGAMLDNANENAAGETPLPGPLKPTQSEETKSWPWWLLVLKSLIFGKRENILPTLGRLVLLTILLLLLVWISLFISVKYFGFRVEAGQIYVGANEQSLGAHVTVDATAGLQDSGITVKKGQILQIHPEGRIHTAMDHVFNLTRAVKGFIVNDNLQKNWPQPILRRYSKPDLTEGNVFYRDWCGPEGEAAQSDLLEDCKLRKDLNWGALMAIVLPSSVSARADPFEILKDDGLTSQDLIPIPNDKTITIDRDGTLVFIINEAVLSPYSPSHDSQMYYETLKQEAENLSGDPRHQIPLQSVPLVFFGDNSGAFRITIKFNREKQRHSGAP